MTITTAHVEAVLRRIPGAYGGQPASLDELAAGANEALSTAPHGLTPQGAAAFLATMSQESGSFRYLTEAGSASYLKSKPYFPYVGRTFEQITWASNYRAFGVWCNLRGLVVDLGTFVNDPKSLADIRWAWLGGVWFWERNGIWAWANKGNFLATQRAVNLGSPTSSKTPAGMAARNAWYQAWLKVGADLIPTPTDPAAPTGRPLDMGSATDIFINYQGAQALVPGDNEISISATSKTLVIGPNDGIDVAATVGVFDATGARVPATAFFRIVSYKDKTPTTTTSSRRPGIPGADAYFKGDISADADSSRSPRLRLVVNVPDGVTDLVAQWVQVTGWKL